MCRNGVTCEKLYPQPQKVELQGTINIITEMQKYKKKKWTIKEKDNRAK